MYVVDGIVNGSGGLFSGDFYIVYMFIFFIIIIIKIFIFGII